MIYTFTLNPSLDYIMEVDSLGKGRINRSHAETLRVGGKGINVSIVLKELGVESIACGLMAGTVGKAITEELDKASIPHKFIKVLGNSRINIKLVGESETAINGSGCIASKSDVDRLCMLTSTKEEDYVVLSGSVCNGLDKDIYAYIMENTEGKFIVDATGGLLTNTLKYKPYLIKPNNAELGEIFGCSVDTYEDAVLYGRRLCDMGAQNVLVSMGKRGAVFVNADESFYAEGNGVKVKNTVGAGDTMLASFLHYVLDGRSYEEALTLSVDYAEKRISRI